MNRGDQFSPFLLWLVDSTDSIDSINLSDMNAQDFYNAAQEAEDIGAYLEYMEHYEILCSDDPTDSIEHDDNRIFEKARLENKTARQRYS